MQGYGRLLGPLISPPKVVPPGFPWIPQGAGQPRHPGQPRDRGSRPGSAELGFEWSASRIGQSGTHRLCQTNHLRGCANCAAIQPLHRNNIGREQASKGPVDDLTDLCENLLIEERAQGKDQSPMASIALVRPFKGETRSLVSCLGIYTMKEVLIRGTKEETGSEWCHGTAHSLVSAP